MKIEHFNPVWGKEKEANKLYYQLESEQKENVSEEVINLNVFISIEIHDSSTFTLIHYRNVAENRTFTADPFMLQKWIKAIKPHLV